MDWREIIDGRKELVDSRDLRRPFINQYIKQKKSCKMGRKNKKTKPFLRIFNAKPT